jgi:hypothetical protein
MPRSRGPPRGHPTLHGTKLGMPVLPLILTPSRNWGPPNYVLRPYTRFYTSGSALRHSRSWPLFRDFGRENFTVMPKSGVLLFTIATASPRQSKTKKNTKGREPNRKNGRERKEQTLRRDRETELRSEYSRSQDGIEILRGEMRPLAVWLEMTRSADAPGTRKVVFPGRRLHEASPTGSGSPGSEPLCPGRGVLHVATLCCTGQT